jgi:hypothetical protein
MSINFSGSFLNTYLRIKWNAAKIHKGGTMTWPLVIYPEHDCLMNSIPGDMIYNIFFTTQKLLAKNCRAISTIDHLTVHENFKVLLSLFIRMTKLDSIRSSRLHRFENHWVWFCLEKLFHIGKLVSSSLSNRA